MFSLCSKNVRDIKFRYTRAQTTERRHGAVPRRGRSIPVPTRSELQGIPVTKRTCVSRRSRLEQRRQRRRIATGGEEGAFTTMGQVARVCANDADMVSSKTCDICLCERDKPVVVYMKEAALLLRLEDKLACLELCHEGCATISGECVTRWAPVRHRNHVSRANVLKYMPCYLTVSTRLTMRPEEEDVYLHDENVS